MEYYIINEKNQQVGPLTILQLKEQNIKKTTKVWSEGMIDWVIAQKISDLNSLFITPPPIPSNTPPFPQNISSPIKKSKKQIINIIV